MMPDLHSLWRLLQSQHSHFLRRRAVGAFHHGECECECAENTRCWRSSRSDPASVPGSPSLSPYPSSPGNHTACHPADVIVWDNARSFGARLKTACTTAGTVHTLEWVEMLRCEDVRCMRGGKTAEFSNSRIMFPRSNTVDCEK